MASHDDISAPSYNDIGDYMEWSGEGWYPVNMSNDAYKFATNYIVCGLTH